MHRQANRLFPERVCQIACFHSQGHEPLNMGGSIRKLNLKPVTAYCLYVPPVVEAWFNHRLLTDWKSRQVHEKMASFHN